MHLSLVKYRLTLEPLILFPALRRASPMLYTLILTTPQSQNFLSSSTDYHARGMVRSVATYAGQSMDARNTAPRSITG